MSTMKLELKLVIAILGLVLPGLGSAGVFAPAAGQPNSTAVAADEPTIDAWATGYEDYQPGLAVDLEFQTPAKALGEPGNSDGTHQGTIFDIVSLGRGGSITLTFNPSIRNGTGFDFAVFENSFSDTFLELAKVEVSSDGQNFVAFPAFSLVSGPVSGFGNVDPTDIEQLAGKYRGGYGMPFDLQQLIGNPLLDLNNIRYVRLIDIVGDGSVVNDLTPESLAYWLGLTVGELPQALIDIVNNAPAAIYDPYATVGSAGFDLDAVAVLEAGPISVTIDIDIWSSNNEIDPASSAQIPVGVFTTSLADGDSVEFDASQIDPASLRFGFGEATYQAGPFTLDIDGDGDLEAAFLFQTLDAAFLCEDTDALLIGETYAGQKFIGTDAITTINCETSTCHP